MFPVPTSLRTSMPTLVLNLILACILTPVAGAHPPDDDHAHHEKAPADSKHGSLAETGAFWRSGGVVACGSARSWRSIPKISTARRAR
jgi:hypothetical protein